MALSRIDMRVKVGPNPQVLRKRAEQRAYRCPRCKGWHLTSRPERA